MLNIAVLISGGGTNLQALIDAEKSGLLSEGRIALVISSNKDAFGLIRAKQNGIKTKVLERRSFADPKEFDKALLKALEAEKIHIVVLAGFLSILGDDVVNAYEGRMINIHPSLIPAFCGAGYYGLKVHEAVLEKGVKITGATVHYVSAIPDGGGILFQKAVSVLPEDTPETLQRRVMEEAEWKILPEAAEYLCRLWADRGLAEVEEDPLSDGNGLNDAEKGLAAHENI